MWAETLAISLFHDLTEKVRVIIDSYLIPAKYTESKALINQASRWLGLSKNQIGVLYLIAKW